MSTMVHLNTFLCSIKTFDNLLFYLSSRDDEMIPGKLFLSPKNAYSKVSSNELSPSFGDFDDGLSFFPDDVCCSILNFCLLVSMDGDESNKALTSSIDLSISKFKLK